ncbi:MAG: site-2 protease family protein [Candidatus Heimdallarchaeota archaeon]|nr:site-2 protease family protein [Candidatus Heimdallarchaeota archaeon]
MNHDESSNTPKKDDKTQEPEIKCWNCGSKIQNNEWCDTCKAPLTDESRSEVLNREHSEESIKCWRCKGTTSGDICGICGSPLSKKGIVISAESVRPQISGKTEPDQDFIFVLSPRDRLMKKIPVKFSALEELVGEHFQVVNAINTNIGPEIIVEVPKNNDIFDEFEQNTVLVENNLRTIIRNSASTASSEKLIIMRFFYWMPEVETDRFSFVKNRWRIVFFALTLVSLYLTGWLYYREINKLVILADNLHVNSLIFTTTLIGILIIHELGHFMMQRIKKIKLSLPYFIPLPPTPGLLSYFLLGSAGTVVRVIDPVRKRDDLFDLYFIGPVFGLVVSIALYLVGIAFPYIIDRSTLSADVLTDIETLQALDPNLLISRFLDWIGASIGISPAFDPELQVMFIHPLTYAALIGIILNGLNFLPGSLLDGGFMFRSLFSERVSRIFSFLSALVVMLNYNTWTFGILIMFIPRTLYQTPATNQAIPVHWSKYVLEVLALGIAACSLPLTVFFFR